MDAGPIQSIGNWVSCTGVTDDSLGAAAAFAAAADGGFTLVVDCPVFIHIGTDITRPIFVENDTTVQFVDGGLFIVDDALMPAFVLVDTDNVTFRGWQVEYVGSVPVDYKDAGYHQDGGFVPGYDPAGIFNDVQLTPWMTSDRGVVFVQDAGHVGALWASPTNTSAMFYIAGSSSNITVTDMSLFVPQDAGGARFIPMCFSMTPDYTRNQAVNALTPLQAPYFAIPSNLTFTNIDLDGTYMGWQGDVSNLTVTNVQSHRYGDLQDPDGGTVGGVGKWFAPPHLFYLDYGIDGDPSLFAYNTQIANVMDYGVRVGVARDLNPNELGGQDGGACLDAGGACLGSGYALSLKIGNRDSGVDNYTSYRPDGMMDVLSQGVNMTLSNITGTYDSSFLNDVYPGIRWPGPTNYDHVALKNVSLTDLAARSIQPPLGSQLQTTNVAVTATGLDLTVNAWAGPGSLVATFGGSGESALLDYTLLDAGAHIQAGQVGDMTWQLGAAPATVAAGVDSLLTWSSKNATTCSASGAWNGPQALSGTASQTLPSAGDVGFALTCAQDGGGNGTVAVNVTVTP